MIDLLRKWLGLNTGPKVSDIIRTGATIIDVRSKAEYNSGHIKGSVNIPLDQISSAAAKLKGKEPIVLCCASGMRSASAAGILKSKGFKEVYNGGSWQKVKQYLN